MVSHKTCVMVSLVLLLSASLVVSFIDEDEGEGTQTAGCLLLVPEDSDHENHVIQMRLYPPFPPLRLPKPYLL